MEVLKKFNACNEAIEFASNYEKFEDAWAACPRGDWMLWIAEKLNVDERILFKAKGLCTKTVIHLMRDERSRNAVKVCIDFGNNKATKEELRNAADAAYAAYAAAAADYAASSSSAYAADTDASAIHAASAAYAASYANSANAADTAKICRKVLTSEVMNRLYIIKASSRESVST